MRSLFKEHLGITRPKLEILETGDGLAAWELFKRKVPAYVVVDLMLPGMDGQTLLHLMARHHMPPRVMVLTGRTLEEDAASMRREFDSFIWMEKGASLERVDAAVCDLLAAGPLKIMPRLVHAEEGNVATRRLTARERVVLALVASGQRTRSISEVLGLSPHTVHVHRRNIMRKLQLNSSAQLAVFAIKHGLAKMEEV